MIKNIIFDVDGVLRYTREISVKDILPAHMLLKYGDKFDGMTTKQFSKNIRGTSIFKLYDRGEITEDDMISTICELEDEPKDAYLLLHQVSCNPQNNVLIEPTFNLIRNLKNRGYNIYILSNMGPEKAKMLRGCIDVNLFNDIIFSCEVGHIKPEVEMYQTAIKKFNVLPSETLFVDDREENLVPFKWLGGHTLFFDLKNLNATLNNIETYVLNENN